MINFFENMGGIAILLFEIAYFFISPISQFLFNIETFANLFYIRIKPHPDSFVAKNKILYAFSKLNKKNFQKIDLTVLDKIKLFLTL